MTTATSSTSAPPYALVIPPTGRARVEELPTALPDEGFLWLDFDRTQARDWQRVVEELTGLQVLRPHVTDSLNVDHPSFTDRATGYEMIIFRGLGEGGADTLDSRPTAFFLAERLLVTVRPPDSRSILAVRERLLGGQGRTPRRPVGLTHLILSTMVDRFLALRDTLSTELEVWQRDLLDPKNPFDDWTLLMERRNALRRLQRLCEEQEDAVVQWREDLDEDLDESLTIRFNDLLEHVRRVSNHTKELQHAIEALVQMHFSAVAHRTNEIVRTLTVITAIFLPLSLVAGIFGMNFANMPELQLRWAYPVVLTTMITLGVGMAMFFRRKHWF